MRKVHDNLGKEMVTFHPVQTYVGPWGLYTKRGAIPMEEEKDVGNVKSYEEEKKEERQKSEQMTVHIFDFQTPPFEKRSTSADDAPKFYTEL